MSEQMRKDFEAWASDNLYSITYTPDAECGCEGGPVYADSCTHAAWWAYRHGLQKAEEYAAKRYADGVNAAVADMLPELERVRAALASQAVPTIASLIERFGDVPGELEVCGEASLAKAAPKTGQGPTVQHGAWIPVSERLPSQYVEVLVALSGISIPSTGQYTGSSDDRDPNGWCYPAENNGTCDDGSDPVVTHWMPLPDPPKSNVPVQESGS